VFRIAGHGRQRFPQLATVRYSQSTREISQSIVYHCSWFDRPSFGILVSDECTMLTDFMFVVITVCLGPVGAGAFHGCI